MSHAMPLIDPVNDTFLDVQNMIYKLVNAFSKNDMLDKDELLSAAHEGFLEAYETHTQKKGAFTTRCYSLVVFRLRDVIRKQKVLSSRFPREVFSFKGEYNSYEERLDTLAEEDNKRARKPLFTLIDKRTSAFSLEDWCDAHRLSSDARLVAKIALDTPLEVKLTLAQLASDIPVNVRFAIREYLIDLGWCKSRIKRSFLELKRSI